MSCAGLCLVGLVQQQQHAPSSATFQPSRHWKYVGLCGRKGQSRFEKRHLAADRHVRESSAPRNSFAEHLSPSRCPEQQSLEKKTQSRFGAYFRESSGPASQVGASKKGPPHRGVFGRPSDGADPSDLDEFVSPNF